LIVGLNNIGIATGYGLDAQRFFSLLSFQTGIRTYPMCIGDCFNVGKAAKA
jgi:hypothetical protein